MKISKDRIGKFDTHKVEFDSLHDFYDYIMKTPTNKVFSDAENERQGWSTRSALASQRVDRVEWRGTSSFEEAIELFKNGIPDTAEKLTQMLKAEKKLQPVKAMKRENSIQGFQPVVPLYLIGVPNNMISTKMKPVKQKVVNIYTDISYLCDVSSKRLQSECIKKFRLISKLESQNYRVNLFLLFGTKTEYKGSMYFMSSIKLKGANERLNISKLAFPLTHPSMERRLMFRLVETYPDIVEGFIHGYGTTIPGSILDAAFNGYILPNFITKDIDKINSLDDLKKL